jgi:hypothetical protein
MSSDEKQQVFSSENGGDETADDFFSDSEEDVASISNAKRFRLDPEEVILSFFNLLFKK